MDHTRRRQPHDPTTLSGSDAPIDPDLAPDDPGEPHVRAPSRQLRHRHGRAQPGVLVAIALGGMLGASARYGIARLLPVESGQFPWATFWTNLSGSFVLGFVMILVLERLAGSRFLRPFLATGILGAFTTMSTYQVETTLLVKDGSMPTAVIYSLGSMAAGVALAYLGIVAGRLVPLRHLGVSR